MRKTLRYVYYFGIGISLIVNLIFEMVPVDKFLIVFVYSLYPFTRENFGFKGDNIKYYRALQIMFFLVFILSYIFDFKYGMLSPALILLIDLICYQKFLTWGEFRTDEIQTAKVT